MSARDDVKTSLHGDHMLTDTQIIDNTTISNEDGDTFIRILPPGYDTPIQQKATSEESARKHIIAWCEHVRAVMSLDAENARSEKEYKKAQRMAGKAPPEALSPTAPIATAEDNPIEYARRQRDLAQELVTEAEENAAMWKAKREKLRLALENWERILESLRGEDDDGA